LAVAETVAALAGSTETASRADEVPWAVRTLFESMAHTRPLVVVMDDLHWAEPTLLDLVEHVADWSRDAPILLLCVARQELLDVRPGWAGGKFNATSIHLEPLSEVDSAVLIGNLLGEISDGESVRSRIARAAEGNPLFVEELTAMLIDDGVLVRRGDRWEAAADLDAVSIPPTISALLAARLDRLADQERSVIERASVVGASFYRNAVAELSLPTSGPQVAANLMTLVRKELIRPERSSLAGDDAFHFRHLLIRDAAYAALPKRERAELHERFADWLSSAAGGEVHQYDEIIGFHLEQACRQRSELGMHDERQQRLAMRAAHYLSSAGRRALSLEDAPAAAGLLDRAVRIAPATERPELAADLVDALIVQGRLDDARRVLDEHDSEGEAQGAAALALARVHLQIETSGALPATLATELEGLTERLGGGAPQHRIRALMLSSAVSWLGGRVRLAEQQMQEALTVARAAGDRRQRSHALTELAFYAVIGPTPVDVGLDLCLRLLDEAQDDRPMRAALLRSAGDLHGMRGEFDQSRRLGEESRTLYEELGLKLAGAQASVDFSMIELEAGDPLAAEAMARAGFEVLQEMGEHAYLSSCAALLAEALHAQGLNHEASRFVEISERNAHTNDVIGGAQWRSVKAKVLAASGRTEEAVRIAQTSVDQLAGTDLEVFKGGALMALGEVLRTAGRVGESVAAFEQAKALYERKGALVLHDHARALLMELADDDLTPV
jgi:tetratricopeptide (TPR) repeat protein